MFLRKWLFLVGILILLGVVSYSLLTNSFKYDVIVAGTVEKDPFITQDNKLKISILEMVTESIYDKYDDFSPHALPSFFSVKTTTNNNLVIKIEGDKEYFNSVIKDIESIAKSVIKSSSLKEYTVVVERVK